jgi:hypothetical protein
MASQRFVLLVIASAALTAGCSAHLPALETAPGNGPTVSDIVDHINCELASIVNAKPVESAVTNTENVRLIDRAAADKNFARLLPRLTYDHFVASVLMSLDVSDTESVSPSLSFITPYNASGSFNRVLGIGGSLSGTQERNVSLGYSIDLANLQDTRDGQGHIVRYVDSHHCNILSDDVTIVNNVNPSGSVGLAGDLGLADIVADGLIGLDKSKDVNVYGSGGPINPNVTREVTTTLSVKIPPPPGNTNPTLIPLTLTGSITFSPPANPQSMGTVTLTGWANTSNETQYAISMTGTTFPMKNGASVTVAVSGTLALLASSSLTDGAVVTFGTGPGLALTGTIDDNYTPSQLAIQSGVLTASPNAGSKVLYQVTPGTTAISPTKNKSYIAGSPGAPGAAAPGAPGPAKGASTASVGSTEFGSLVNFVIGYGLNGGPTWTLTHFKGPSAGSGQLLNVTRTNTDSLTITFVAACKDGPTKATVTDYWSSIPECDDLGTLRQQASNIGAQNNLLLLSGRGY